MYHRDWLIEEANEVEGVKAEICRNRLVAQIWRGNGVMAIMISVA